MVGGPRIAESPRTELNWRTSKSLPGGLGLRSRWSSADKQHTITVTLPNVLTDRIAMAARADREFEWSEIADACLAVAYDAMRMDGVPAHECAEKARGFVEECRAVPRFDDSLPPLNDDGSPVTMEQLIARGVVRIAEPETDQKA